MVEERGVGRQEVAGLGDSGYIGARSVRSSYIIMTGCASMSCKE